MRLFKQKVLSLITAVCMIATSAAPVFATGETTDGVTDSGYVKATWTNSDSIDKVEFLDSGNQTYDLGKDATVKVASGKGTLTVTTKADANVTAVKVAVDNGTAENAEKGSNNSWTYVLKSEVKTTNGSPTVFGITVETKKVDTPIESVTIQKGSETVTEAMVGETLTAVVKPDGADTNVSYKWLSGTDPIAGTDSKTFILTSGQIGKTVKVEVTAKDNSGYTGTKTSTDGVAVKAKTFTVALDPNAPSASDTLKVTTDPADAATSATFAWYEGTSADSVTSSISGQTGATLDLTNYAGKYIKVVVTGTGDYKGVKAEATTTSAVSAAGTVNAQAPKIEVDLDVTEVFYTKDATAEDLSVTDKSPDNGNLSHQWYSNTTGTVNPTSDTPVGTNSNTFTPPTDTVGTTYYYVVVTNTNDTVNGNKTATTTSKLAKITVKAAVTESATPTFKTDLQSAMAVEVDGTLTLTVKAEVTDGGTLSYQWYKGDAEISSATSAIYTKTNVEARDAGSYKVVVTNTKDDLTPATANSTVCVVTVSSKVEIDSDIQKEGITEVVVPVDQVPDGATLKVEAKNEPSSITSDVSSKITTDSTVSAKVESINTKNVVSMEITLQESDGTEVSPKDGTLTITMDKPNALTGNNIVAIHYNDDGKTIKEIVFATFNNGKITFTLNGLSPVVLAEYTPKTVTPPNPKPDNGNHNNSGGSGGSGGGGGGGSSGSNKSQSIFQKTTSTINNILKGWFGGTSRKATTGATSAAAVAGTPVTESVAAKAASSAASQAKAKGSDSFNAIVRNATTVPSKAFEAVASQAQKSGLKGYLAADTIKNGVVDVRVSVLASAASRLGKDLNMYAVCGNQAIEKHFNKYFSNKTAVVSMSQKGSFGVTVNVAAKVNLKGMDAKNLHIYSYDVASNSYRELPQKAYFIDGNGYLHFTTDMGGYIVISDGVLTLH